MIEHNKASVRAGAPLSVVRRERFTLFMSVALLVVAVFQGTLVADTAPAVILYWGFGLHNLWDGRLYTLIVSTFLVRQPWEVLGGILLVAVSVGVYEWMVGTRNSLLLYWSTNLTAPVLAALLFLWPHYLAGTSLGVKLAALSDVGPSAGALGCLGGWVGRLPARYRTWVAIAVLALLVAKLALFTDLIPDSSHLVGFVAGLAFDRWLIAASKNPAGGHAGGPA
jgi:hypothetical protein